MINVCSLCDKNYLPKMLAMIQSLRDTKTSYRLHWLCLDRETYLAAQNVNDSELSLNHFLEDLEDQDKELAQAKNNPATNYGSQRDNYIWSLTPYFMNYLLKNYIVDNEFLMYVDSDIFFYESPSKIIDVIDNKSCGIHTHRFGPNRKKLDVGWYNVGVVVIRNDYAGRHLSDCWKYWTLHPNNPFYAEYGTCGDQKFLERFELTIGEDKVCVFDQDERISHRAPWCCDEDNRPVVFFHFSHFNYNLQENTWSDSNHGEWRPSRHEHIRPYYEQYFEKIKQVNKLIE